MFTGADFQVSFLFNCGVLTDMYWIPHLAKWKYYTFYLKATCRMFSVRSNLIHKEPFSRWHIACVRFLLTALFLCDISLLPLQLSGKSPAFFYNKRN